MTTEEMRKRARRYRLMANVIIDAQANKALHDLADEYDALAEKGETGEMGNDRPGSRPDKENPGPGSGRES